MVKFTWWGYADNPVYEYTPANDSWVLKTHVPTVRQYCAVATAANKIYVIGGLQDEYGDSKKCGLNEAYDPATNTWETKMSMPTNRSQIEANVVNGKIYVAGGRTSGPQSTVSIMEVYDPATDSWETEPSMPYPVVSYVSAVANGKIYIIGGQDEYLTYSGEPCLNTTQIYNPETRTWTIGAPAPAQLWQGAAAATSGVYTPKRIYVFGGMSGFAMGLDQTLIYDPEADVWTTGATMPTARYNPVAAVVNDVLYVIGGGQALNQLSANEQYTPVGYNGPAVPLGSTPSPKPSALGTLPSPNLTTTPSPSPSVPELQSWVVLLIIMASAVVCAAAYRKNHKPRGEK
jgi:N-acetylneuraminic acid mutarotase